MLLDGETVPVRVLFPIKIDEHPEVRATNDVLGQFNSYVTDEFCSEFNSRPFSDRKLRIEQHLEARQEVKRVIRNQVLSRAERRSKLDTLREQLFPGEVFIDHEEFTLRPRR